jgi:hypothetical protein
MANSNVDGLFIISSDLIQVTNRSLPCPPCRVSGHRYELYHVSSAIEGRRSPMERWGAPAGQYTHCKAPVAFVCFLLTEAYP